MEYEHISHILRREENEALRSVTVALEAVKSAGEMMSARNVSLVDADDALQWLMNFLQDQNTEFSKLLYEALHARISHRRNGTMIALMRHVEDPSLIYEKESDTCHGLFEVPSRNSIINLADVMFSRLYPSQTDTNEVLNPDPDCLDVQPIFSTPPKANLQKFLKRKRRKLSEAATNKSSFKQELNFYEKSGQRSPRLELLYTAIKSSRATSVESERSFSGLGRFLTKFRTRLSDRNLNCLLILRHYYLSQEN